MTCLLPRSSAAALPKAPAQTDRRAVLKHVWDTADLHTKIPDFRGLTQAAS